MAPQADTGVQSPSERQSGPADSLGEQHVLELALATSQALRALVGLKLADLGLAAGQDRLLLALMNRESISVSELASDLNVRPSTVSKMMDRLSARGYTQRHADTVDARRINVELTAEGRKICERLYALWQEIEAEFVADLSAKDAQRMLDGLTLLHAQVAQRLRRLR